MAKEIVYTGYDVKLKKKVKMKDCTIVVMSNGMKAVKGTSTESGVGMYKIIGKATPEEIKKYGMSKPKKGGKKKMAKKEKKSKKIMAKKGTQSDEDKAAKRKARRLARKAKVAKEAKKGGKKNGKKKK